MEIALRLEHTGDKRNTPHIIFALTGAQTHHHDDEVLKLTITMMAIVSRQV